MGGGQQGARSRQPRGRGWLAAPAVGMDTDTTDGQDANTGHDVRAGLFLRRQQQREQSGGGRDNESELGFHGFDFIKIRLEVKPGLTESMPPSMRHLCLSGILVYPAVLESLIPTAKAVLPQNSKHWTMARRTCSRSVQIGCPQFHRKKFF